MLGAERKDFRANDNGEPSGTAGKPILGQINSNELTDILVIVVRYFGGIKLGTSGLIVAYRTAAAQAIAEATVIEKTVDQDVTVAFEYPFHERCNAYCKRRISRDIGTVVRYGLFHAPSHPQIFDASSAFSSGKGRNTSFPRRRCNIFVIIMT